MATNMNTCLIVGAILVIALLIFLNMKGKKGKKESYSNIGALDNTGTFEDAYELVEAPEDLVPSPHFAELIDSGASGQQPAVAPKIAQRLSVQQGSQLMPRVSKGVTPYNVDVADPITHSYMVNPPRVQLKNPQKMLADPYRGDIPIKYHPNVPLVSQSRFGRDSLRLDGFFSDHFKNLYNKYTGKGYKNMPMSVVNEELVMDA